MYTKISGIYKIVNKLNNKTYIGQSKDCYNRWTQHKTKYKFQNTPLYEDMRKYGIQNFYFKIIEKIPECLLNAREKEYIEKYNTLIPNGYNINKGGNYYGYDSYK